jgi:hypothetical protein
MSNNRSRRTILTTRRIRELDPGWRGSIMALAEITVSPTLCSSQATSK